ncbi:MAG TPA: 50S ribosomal protein L30 [Terriglobales bacterium]|nr:50S ribosomal protein L30 [Terriglobales bacterium]
MAAKTSNKSGGTIQLKWVRSAICAPVKHKKVVKGLGFTRLNQVIERPDTPAIRGMVAKVPHLVEIVSNGQAGR